MSRDKLTLPVLIFAMHITLTACSNHLGDQPQADQMVGDTSSRQQTDSATTDSSLQQEELAKCYTQAIGAFINAAYKRDGAIFDTLYFGKHVYGQPDDFPDIALPEIIEHTQIRLVTPEVGQVMQAARKSLVYVNLMGWLEKAKAEFVFVVFTNGGEHQYDYYINFKRKASSGDFALYEIAFENQFHLNGKKPKRTTIFKDGKFIGDN